MISEGYGIISQNTFQTNPMVQTADTNSYQPPGKPKNYCSTFV